MAIVSQVTAKRKGHGITGLERLAVPEIENLRQSGLTDQTIIANELYTEADEKKIAEGLNRKSAPFGGCALAFRYRELTGELNCFVRFRPRHPRLNEKDRVIKYEAPIQTPSRAYLPAGSLPKLNDGESPIFITEGEKKAMVLSQLGKAAIGITGVYGWKVGGDGERLIPDLAGLDWKARVVYLVFDGESNPDTRRDVRSAGERLARVLREQGSPAVYWIEIPLGVNQEKTGVDDYLVALGNDGSAPFRELVRASKEVGGIKGIKIINPFPPTPQRPLYHGPIGAFIEAVDPHTEAHPMGVLAHLLPAIGTLMGPNVYIEKGGRHPPRINTVLVGPTNAGRKGTSYYPVKLLMQKVAPAFWDKQCINGLSSGEGLIAYVGEDRENDPETKQTITVPREKRLYVVESEFSRVFANKNRDGNVLSQIIREAFDSGNLHTMTVEPRHAVGAHVSITGHITPEELEHCLTTVDKMNGFGNRFLWFFVKSDKVIPNPKPIPEAVFDLLVPRLKALSLDATMHAKAPSERRVEMSPEAQALWERVYTERLRWDDDSLGLAKTLTARGSAMVLRTALIYAALDVPLRNGPCGQVLTESPIIKPVHLKAGLAVWDYCEESAAQLFGGKSDSRCGEKILKLLRENGPMTTTEMNHHLSPGQKSAAKPALEELERQGLIRSEKQKTGRRGAPTTVWSLTARD